MKHSVAILGCGMMGRIHADGCLARPDAQVVAVYDPQEAPARQLAALRSIETGEAVPL